MARKGSRDRGVFERQRKCPDCNNVEDVRSTCRTCKATGHVGTGRWYIRYGPDDTWESAGSSKREAQEAYAKRMLGFEKPSGVTVFDVVQSYLDARKNASRRTDIYFAKTVVAEIGARPVDDLEAGELEELLVTLATRTSNHTANKHVEFLHRCIRRALRDHLVKRDVCVNVKKLTIPPGRTRYLRLEEARRLRDACKSPVDWAIIVLALYTGSRRANVFRARVEDIDFERGVFGRLVKGNKIHWVPLHAFVIAILRDQVKRARERESEWLFPGHDPSRHLNDKVWVRERFKPALERAGIKDFTFHSLRHSFATWLRLDDTELDDVKELMGHSSLAMTNRYAHVPGARLRRAIDGLPLLDDVWMPAPWRTVAKSVAHWREATTEQPQPKKRRGVPSKRR